MKFCKSMLSLFILALSFSSLTIAQNMSRDGNEGGGGDHLIVEFISVANTLIKDPVIDIEDQELLKKTLELTKIEVVTTLKNPVTGQEIPHQKTLVAWGSPKLIQLKLSSGIPGEESWENLVNRNQIVAQYVFHELYRASSLIDDNGKSPDETFQISIGKYNLDKYEIVPGLKKECNDTNRILMESFVYRSALQHFGQSTQIKIASQIYGQFINGKEVCYYQVLYSASYTDEDGKKRDVLSNSIFSYNFYRPYPEQLLKVNNN
jgi:hypothetical protein